MKFLSKLLTEETMSKLVDVLGEDLVKQIGEKTSDFEIDISEQKFIPYNRFKEINEQSKEYKSQIDEREKQLKTLAEQNKGNEELAKKIADLQGENEKAKTDYEHKLKARELEFNIETLAVKNKVRNVKAFKALLDLENVGDDYSKLGEQVNSIKESDPYLFEIEEENSKEKAGMSIKNKKTNVGEFDDFRKI